MLGYRADREDWHYLNACQTPFPVTCCATGEIPEEFHPVLITKNQKQTQSCVGHGLSTLFAALNLLQTGEEVNYSAWFAYLEAQIASNMFGSDDGATLAGAMLAGRNVGNCRDELFPFPGFYSQNIPKKAAEDAKNHQLVQFSQLKGYDDVWRYTSTHQGPVLIGTQWLEGHQAIGKDGLETVQSAWRGASLGYHCRCVIGWSKRRDSQGRHYLWCKNSHSTQWGNMGESEIEPRLFDEWANDRFAAFFGACESRPYEPRPVAWDAKQFVFV